MPRKKPIVSDPEPSPIAELTPAKKRSSKAASVAEEESAVASPRRRKVSPKKPTLLPSAPTDTDQEPVVVADALDIVKKADTRKPSKRVPAKAVPVIPSPEPPEIPPAPEPKSRTRRPKVQAKAKEDELRIPDGDEVLVVSFRPHKGSPPAASKTSTPVQPEFESIEGEDVTIQWRSKRGADEAANTTMAKREASPAATESDDEQLAPKKSRRRRRRGEPEAELPISVPTPEPVKKPEPEVLAAALKKPSIEIPPEAPQVVERSGVPAIVRNHRVYPPIVFFGNPSDERKAVTVFDELRMAAEAGIHLHSLLVQLPVDLDEVDASAAFAAYLLTRSIESDPEAQIIFRIDFVAPRGWQQSYPDSVFVNAEGNIAEPSVCDEKIWGVAEQCLTLFVKKLLLLDGRDHVMGVHLERGEWFLPEGYGYDTSKAATLSFRKWAEHRYLNDIVTLRASWFDGNIRFDSIQVPEYLPEGNDGERFIRSSRKQRRYVDYHLFLSDATVNRISELAYAAKAAAGGMLLVGASYGYTFEWSHPGSGHLALGKLLRTDEIDFIAGPPSYRNREPGGSAPFPCPIDSFALNGKLYISEEDYKTSLSVGHEPDDFNPSLKTPQALESVHWRGAGVALAHASGVEWMDLWGNGWLRTNSVWERASRLKDALVDRMDAPLGDPEVAVFIDERALAYLVDSNAFALLVQNVRESVLRAGVSAAFYLLSDLAHREKFPESKLYLFLNAWDIRPELRAAIKSRLQRDGKVLFWLYSAGLFDAGRESLERAREVTGIALKPQPFYSKAGTTILHRRHPLSEAFPDRSLIGGTKLEPSYFAIPEDGVVLGEYSQTGLPSFVVKEFREDPSAPWTSVFLGEPLVNPALIRALAQMAGAHIWNYHEDVVHVRAPFCTVHCSGTGPRTITLPTKCSAYNLLTQEWAAMDSTNLRFVAIDGSTHMFLVGPRTDIEHVLSASPTDVLYIEELPKRETNIRVDTSNFDVPIMKLDEWIEGGDQDEVADEWFLRPQALIDERDLEPEQAAESPEQVGKRRRRRRRGKGGGPGERMGTEEIVTARVEPSGAQPADDFSMSVMFRKRE